MFTTQPYNPLLEFYKVVASTNDTVFTKLSLEQQEIIATQAINAAMGGVVPGTDMRALENFMQVTIAGLMQRISTAAGGNWLITQEDFPAMDSATAARAVDTVCGKGKLTTLMQHLRQLAQLNADGITPPALRELLTMATQQIATHADLRQELENLQAATKNIMQCVPKFTNSFFPWHLTSAQHEKFLNSHIFKAPGLSGGCSLKGIKKFFGCSGAEDTPFFAKDSSRDRSNTFGSIRSTTSVKSISAVLREISCIEFKRDVGARVKKIGSQIWDTRMGSGLVAVVLSLFWSNLAFFLYGNRHCDQIQAYQDSGSGRAHFSYTELYGRSFSSIIRILFHNFDPETGEASLAPDAIAFSAIVFPLTIFCIMLWFYRLCFGNRERAELSDSSQNLDESYRSY